LWEKKDFLIRLVGDDLAVRNGKGIPGIDIFLITWSFSTDSLDFWTIRMITDKPGKRSFYKYAGPSTVLAILKSKSVRYSSPLTFNDPFDLQSGLHFDFEISTLSEKVLDKLGEYATASEMPPVDESDPWGELVRIVRELYPTHGFPRDKFYQLAGSSLGVIGEQIEITQKGYQEHWWCNLLPGLRVFCVSEERDNLLMWAHYAQDHTGAVFEFLSLPEEDNPLSVARPIQYVSSPPSFFTEKEWLDDIFSVRKLKTTEFYERYAYIKSENWAYEREWRVWYPIIPTPKTLYEDMPIRQSELAALYIGCRAEPAFEAEASELAKVAFPNIRIFKAEKREEFYALKYKEI